MARYDDLDTGSSAYATFVSSVLLLVIILLIRALCCSWVEGEDIRKLADAHYTSSDNTISQQKVRISGYEKVMVEVAPPSDPEAGEDQPQEPVMEERLHIPVERAKELLLKELAPASEEPTT